MHRKSWHLVVGTIKHNDIRKLILRWNLCYQWFWNLCCQCLKYLPLPELRPVCLDSCTASSLKSATFLVLETHVWKRLSGSIYLSIVASHSLGRFKNLDHQSIVPFRAQIGCRWFLLVNKECHCYKDNKGLYVAKLMITRVFLVRSPPDDLCIDI